VEEKSFSKEGSSPPILLPLASFRVGIRLGENQKEGAASSPPLTSLTDKLLLFLILWQEKEMWVENKNNNFNLSITFPQKKSYTHIKTAFPPVVVTKKAPQRALFYITFIH